MLKFEYLLNSENVIQTIRYSKHKLKVDFGIYLVFTMILSILWANLLFVYTIGSVSGEIMEIIAFGLPLCVSAEIVIWFSYVKEKKFLVNFDKDGITISYGKKSSIYCYNDIKAIGILHGVGTSSFLGLAGGFDLADKYDTVFVTVIDNLNMKKMKYHILTQVLNSCGFYKKTTFFISDYNEYINLGDRIKESITFYSNNAQIQVMEIQTGDGSVSPN